LGWGQAQVVTFGLFNFKIGPGAFKIHALMTGLKNYQNFTKKD
jgi:hypothetical protein